MPNNYKLAPKFKYFANLIFPIFYLPLAEGGGNMTQFLKMLNDDKLSSFRFLNCDPWPSKISWEKNFILQDEVQWKIASSLLDHM